MSLKISFSRKYSQFVSSMKVIQKSTFVLSRSAPIRHSERPVWASSLPDSFNNIMAVVKMEISCLHFSELLPVLASNTTWTAENAGGK